jgi:RNA polymerase sigma factor (TIGR02999 family)
MGADVPTLLGLAKTGDQAALNELLPIVYAELHKLAAAYLRSERSNHTLQPTALVNEVYLRLVGKAHPDYADRAHFLGVAAYLMRQILTEHARRRNAVKRGGGKTISLDQSLDFSAEQTSAVIAVDDALRDLSSIDAEQARLVELRFYGGMTAEEIALLTGTSVHRVRHVLRVAMAWLHQQITAAGGE